MIATLTEFKNYLQVDVDDATKNTFYTDLLTRAQAEIEKYIDYPIEQSTVTLEIHNCSRIIIPNQIPITTLVVKYIAEYGVDASDVTLTQYTDYFNYDTYIVFESYNNPDDRRRIKLSYVGGYASALVPQPLIDAVIQYAAYKLNLNRPLEPKIEIDTRILKEIKEIINPYRKMILP
jgi:hypothetical protein